jgi:phosphoglycolate phosphatase-like HAD superfamily hydrolase
MLKLTRMQQNAITIPLLKKYGLMQKFSKICGGISDKAKALQNIATAFRFSVKQMAYVGDQESDILHAQKAGCISIAFCGGLHEHERLKRAKPDFIITSMPELANLPIV